MSQRGPRIRDVTDGYQSDPDDQHTPRDNGGMTQYRRRGGNRSPIQSSSNNYSNNNNSSSSSKMSVNLNVEQMISMIFEMRGQLQHEMEARRANEMQLHETRMQIDSLKDISQRDNTKWSNLIGRVKELEVGSRLDTRLGEMTSKQDKFTRNNDQSKLLSIFNDIKLRMDTSERNNEQEFGRIQRENQRDLQRIEQDLRAMYDQQYGKYQLTHQQDLDHSSRLLSRINELEKEFGIFMNAQVQMQQNMNNKEKDGDWLKIYLTEQFNAQKYTTEMKFQEVQQRMEKMEEKSRIDLQSQQAEYEKKINELNDTLEQERQTRDSQIRKLTKGLKLSIQQSNDNLSKAIEILDGKMTSLKQAQNEAITTLHQRSKEEKQERVSQQHLLNDMTTIQTEASTLQHTLSTKITNLEEVLKAEIKSRLKNYAKMKQQVQQTQSGIEGKINEFQAEYGSGGKSVSKRKQEEEHVQNLFNQLEARSVLDSMITQIDEQHSIELRKNEWKAFGSVIELELKNHEEELERKIFPNGQRDREMMSHVPQLSEKLDELNTYVHAKFTDFETQQSLEKMEERTSQEIKKRHTETKSVMDSMLTYIVEKNETDHLRMMEDSLRVLDQRTNDISNDIYSLKHTFNLEHESTSQQFLSTHDEITKVTAELAIRIDAHTQQMSEVQGEMREIQAAAAITSAQPANSGVSEQEFLSLQTDVIHAKMSLSEMNETAETTRKEIELLQARMDESSETTESQNAELQTLRNQIIDALSATQSQQLSTRSVQASLIELQATTEKSQADMESKIIKLVAESVASSSSSSSSLVKPDDILLLQKRVDTCERITNDLSHQVDTTTTKTLRIESSYHAIQSLLDTTTASSERKYKEVREKYDTEIEDTNGLIKKLEKRVQASISDSEHLSNDIRTQHVNMKAQEDALGEIRIKLNAFVNSNSNMGAMEKGSNDGVVKQLKMDVKELSSRVDSFLSTDKYSRDQKEVQSSIHELQDAQVKDVKTMREALRNQEDLLMKAQKDLGNRMQALDEQLLSLSSNRDDLSKSSQSRRIVDASIVEKEVQTVEANLDQLAKKLKDTNNQYEDSLNRIMQDMKKLTLKVESLEQTSSGVNKNSSEDSSSSSLLTLKKSLSDVSYRLDTIEKDLKLSNLSTISTTLNEITSKSDASKREVENRLSTIELRSEKIDTDLKRISEQHEETDAKSNKRYKEIQQSMIAQTQHDLEIQNAIKLEVSKQQSEVEQTIRDVETRVNGNMKTIQKQVDAQEVDFKSHCRKMDEKMHEMSWSLEYAKDEQFKKDAKQIRASGGLPKATAAPPIQHSPPRVEREIEQPYETELTGHLPNQN